MMPDYWFERGIADIAQSTGVTSTGLILLRVADPDLETRASTNDRRTSGMAGGSVKLAAAASSMRSP
ncbi:hypothetical protein HLB23_25680 [Nocardia uniformis]|uniref:Uncharacterized protein n=1 Tax=Nocardia uniformis TaxID=53432 RepID=A0A849C666_9NOCA|nr:hypothetical protein [Nocardia uniformis]NNH73206.1 hypothetical protein [Nocardia uniformis]